MEKKTLNDKELNNVSGGAGGDSYPITCPNCGNCQDYSQYGRESIGSGCDEETRYTCPKCGHVFTK